MISSPSSAAERRSGILSSPYLATTVGMFGLIAFVAFEAMAVTTVMPTVARDLDGFSLYALAFAAPLASGVVGMVGAGMWSDRTGPVGPLLVSMALFSLGLVVCGAAPTMEVLIAGRVLQGLGGGALVVGLYVIVGLARGRAWPARRRRDAAAAQYGLLLRGGLHRLRPAGAVAESTDRDRGFNSSALSVADSLGAALALSVCGVAFTAVRGGGPDPFLVVFVVASGIGLLGVVAAIRTPHRSEPSAV